jgi:hypothetical protein
MNGFVRREDRSLWVGNSVVPRSRPERRPALSDPRGIAVMLEPAASPVPRMGRCGLQPRHLHHALVTLSSEKASVSERDSAARQLLRQLAFLAPLCLSRCLPGVMRVQGTVRSGAMLDDAIQHVAAVVTTGRARFRGTHPFEAVAWCSSVLTNQVLSELRWQSRHRNLELFDFALPAQASAVDARIAVGHLRRDLLNHLEQTRTPRVADSLFRAACCYLDHLAGTSLDQQIERWAGEGDRSVGNSSRMTRARNRIYQYHRRGRRVLNELLEPALVGRFGDRAGMRRPRAGRGRELHTEGARRRRARCGAPGGR